MARPPKKGLDYFPFDVDFFDDAVIVTLSGKFGVKGESVVMRLLCAIFKNGYYALWNDPLRYKLRKDVPGTSPEFLDRLVEYLTSSGYFDVGWFRQAQCLTSREIQERYFKAVERRKKTDGEYPYLLINVDRNHSSTDISAYINPQSKLKEINKEKKEEWVIRILKEKGCASPEEEYEKLVRWNDGRHIRSGGWAALPDEAKEEAARLWRAGGRSEVKASREEPVSAPDTMTVDEECAYWLEYGTTTGKFARHDKVTRDAVMMRIQEMIRSGVKSKGKFLKQCYARNMGAEKFLKQYRYVDVSDIGIYIGGDDSSK